MKMSLWNKCDSINTKSIFTKWFLNRTRILGLIYKYQTHWKYGESELTVSYFKQSNCFQRLV